MAKSTFVYVTHEAVLAYRQSENSSGATATVRWKTRSGSSGQSQHTWRI